MRKIEIAQGQSVYEMQSAVLEMLGQPQIFETGCRSPSCSPAKSSGAGYKLLKEGEPLEYEIDLVGVKPQAGKGQRLEDTPQMSLMPTAAPASMQVAA